MKRNNGITLIALVITIVVLIILAGVAINLSIGDNGIFNKAKYAGEQYLNEQVKEEVEIGKYPNKIDSFIGGTSRAENDYKIEQISLPFTVPEDGFLQINLQAGTGGNGYYYIKGASAGWIRAQSLKGWSATTMGFVKKGDEISLEASGNVASVSIKYIH